jgi:hypothetical protein
MPLGDLQNPYDLIIIGRGAAAADYLLTVPRRYNSLADSEPIPLTILVIGEKDPWADARGYVKGAYAQYVNQEKQVLQRRTGDLAPTSQGPQDRHEFAAETEEILNSLSGNNVKEGIVRQVSEVGENKPSDRATFKVESTVGEFYGHKIVFATGAGIEGAKGHADYHMVPGEVTKAWPGGPPAGVMNLDQFIKLADREPLGAKKVAVLGPTAGTDAVMTALTLKVPPQNLYWLMRGKASTAGFANVYPGKTALDKAQISSAQQKAVQNTVAYTAETLVLSTAGGGKIKVRCSQVTGDKEPLMGMAANKMFDADVDYFVYSIGQTATNTMTAPPQDAKSKAVKVLNGDLGSRLEPVYDINQRLGSAPWEHVTAVQLTGSHSEEGLVIIGAAAFQVAGKVDHNFLQHDFDQLRTSILHDYPAFEACARQHYPELLEALKLKDMPKLSLEDCNGKQNALLLAWRKRIDESVKGWMEWDLMSPGDKTKFLDKRINAAKHLCYLYQQRSQAATYLFEQNGTGKSVQDLLKPTAALPDSLSDCRLLAAVNANISALNASAPKHLQKQTFADPLNVRVEVHANYLEDKTELRCYIAAHYPRIEEQDAQTFIARVTEQRKRLGNMGFEQSKVIEFERELERLANKPGNGRV